MHNYKELEVWKKSVDLAVNIYSLSMQFPSEEKFGLISQTRRCSVSVASNIAEGAGRNSPKEFNNFLGYSNGSCCELETQMIIAEKVGLINKADFDLINDQIQRISKMLFNLKKSIKF